MRKTYTLTILLFSALLFVACSGSKSFYKKGRNLEKNGLTAEAANFYIEALKRKKTNDDAIIALKTLGQKVLDEKYSTFYKYYSDERPKDAVYAYLEAEEFKSKVSAVGVILTSSPYYRDYYVEARDLYVAELYTKAESHLQNESFKDAELVLNEIKILDPSYKDVGALSDFAFIEPKYRQGLRAYDSQEYRKAYGLFKEINNRVQNGYKESFDYMQLALESAQYTIGILPIENKSGLSDFESGISGAILTALKDLNDPFIKLVDRTQRNKLLEEQYYNMTGAVDPNSVRETGTMLGTKAILVGKVLSATKSVGALRKFSRTGWLGKEVAYVDPATGAKKKRIVYSKAYYYEYQQESTVSCTFQYQLLSTATGEVLISDIIELSERDEINYATFNGDSRLLIAGYWKNQYRNDPSDRQFSSIQQKRELDNLLRGRREITPIDKLTTSAYNGVGSKVARSVGLYNPEAK